MAWWQMPVTDGSAIYRKEFVNQFIEMYYRLFAATPTVGGVSGDDSVYSGYLHGAGDVAVSAANVLFELRRYAVAKLPYAVRRSAIAAGADISDLRPDENSEAGNESTRPIYYHSASGTYRYSSWFLGALNANHPRATGTPFAPNSFLAPSDEFGGGTMQAFPWTRKFTKTPADPDNPQPDEWPNVITKAAEPNIVGIEVPEETGDIYGVWLFEEFYALLVTMQRELAWPSNEIGISGMYGDVTQDVLCSFGDGSGTSLGYLPCNPSTQYSLTGATPVEDAAADAEDIECPFPEHATEHVDGWRPAGPGDGGTWASIDPGVTDTSTIVLGPGPCEGEVVRAYAQNASATARRARWKLFLSSGVPGFPMIAAARATEPYSPFGSVVFTRWDDFGSASDSEIVAVEELVSDTFPSTPAVVADIGSGVIGPSGLLAHVLSTGAYAAVGYGLDVHFFYALPPPEVLAPSQPNPFAP